MKKFMLLSLLLPSVSVFANSDTVKQNDIYETPLYQIEEISTDFTYEIDLYRSYGVHTLKKDQKRPTLGEVYKAQCSELGYFTAGVSKIRAAHSQLGSEILAQEKMTLHYMISTIESKFPTKAQVDALCKVKHPNAHNIAPLTKNIGRELYVDLINLSQYAGEVLDRVIEQ